MSERKLRHSQVASTAGQSQSINDGFFASRLIPSSSQSTGLAKEKFQLGDRGLFRKQLSAAEQTLRPESTQKRPPTWLGIKLTLFALLLSPYLS